MRAILHDDLAGHIIGNIKPLVEHDVLDKQVWMLDTKGDFSVKSACEYLRRRRDPNIAYKHMSLKGLPFKISFFM